MTTDILLMMRDEIVMCINMDDGRYDIINENLLPWTTKGKWRKVIPYEDVKSKYDMTQNLIASRKNNETFISFLASRVLPITRENAKKIYNIFRLPQLQDEYSKARIAIVCRAVSLQDNYWIKNENDSTKWKDVDLRTNHLSDVVAQIALNGSSLTLTGTPTTPELTGQGAYAKAWFREKDGLYLHKRGSGESDAESRIEVLVSNILDNCNVNHLHYSIREEYETRTCVCKCMTTDDISILPGMDFYTYCIVNGKDPLTETLKIDAESIYKMWIVDYLISNPDRHGMNWGFFYKSDTMDILGCHPLYDHNNAFDKAVMLDDNPPYVFTDKYSMKRAAEVAMSKVDFHFYRDFTRDDFLTERQYESFMRRSKHLGIKSINLDIDTIFNRIPTLYKTDEPKGIQVERFLSRR